MRFRRALILVECEGMDVKTLSAMLGQVSAATTLDIYTHATSDMQYATARKIDCGIGKAVPQKNIPQLGQENAPVTVKKPSMTNFKPCVGHKRESGTDFVIEINYREIMLFYIINICFQRKNISQDNIRMNNTSHSLISCYLMMYACALCIIYLFHPIDQINRFASNKSISGCFGLQCFNNRR